MMTIIFYSIISICVVLIVLALASIADHLRHIRNDLREYFKAEGRRWASDYEWRNSE